jgi:hypothetical protein
MYTLIPFLRTGRIGFELFERAGFVLFKEINSCSGDSGNVFIAT